MLYLQEEEKKFSVCTDSQLCLQFHPPLQQGPTWKQLFYRFVYLTPPKAYSALRVIGWEIISKQTETVGLLFTHQPELKAEQYQG